VTKEVNAMKVNQIKMLPVASALVMAGLTQLTYAQCSGGAGNTIDGSMPLMIGSENPNNGFPLTIQDTNGNLLELCLEGDGNGICFFDPVEAGHAFSEQVGFGPEAFWWLADAGLDFADGGRAILVQGIEAAWVAEVPKNGDQFPFTRLRIRIDAPAPGTYIVTHPYGEITYDIAPGDEGTRAVNDSFDIPIEAFNSEYQGRIGPILTWDPAIAPAAPAGFVGDIGVPHEVVGSPCGTNFFSVKPPPGVDLGAGPGEAMTTDLFNVAGKIATVRGVSIDRVTYNRASNGGGRIDVIATSFPGQELHVTGIGNQNRIMIEDPGTGSLFGTGRYMARMSFNSSTFVPEDGDLITVTNQDDADLGEDTAQQSEADDTVVFNLARFDTRDTWLDLKATSDDKTVTQTITFYDQHGNNLGSAASGSTLTIHPVVPPSYVTAVSSGGGEETKKVIIIGTNVFQ
jgi:hypothetical protein